MENMNSDEQIVEALRRVKLNTARSGAARHALMHVLEALTTMRSGSVAANRTVSESAPVGVPADGDEWIVV